MKVALIQQSFKKSKTVENTVKLVKKASKKGAKLVILQELHQSRYFCISEDERNFSYAKNYKKDVQFWAGVAKKYGVVLVTSLFEKRAAGVYHNTAVVFEKNGKIAGKYRKMHIPDDPGFYEKFYFTPGDLGYKPIQTSVGKLGVLVCWDQWYPEAARLMSLAGADVLIYPTAIGWFDDDSKSERKRQRNSWLSIQKSHAIANGVPVIGVNRVGFEKDKTKQIKGIRFWGNSFVYKAGGELLHISSHKKEELALVDVKLRPSDKIRSMWPFFRDRRIDSYEGLLKRFID